ncbi:MAG: MBL fold metallo-hydrolase [Acetivibrionales bacterium]
MFLKGLDGGMLGSNCYILGDSGEGAVIDAGLDFKETARILSSEGLVLKYIILTHAHIDHVLQADKLKEACGGQVVIHKDDAPLLGNETLNGSFLFGLSKTFNQPDLCVEDGDILELGGLKLEVIHTPGHTPGSICIYVHSGRETMGKDSENAGTGKTSPGQNDCMFTGDTLFRLGVGRTDLGAGDWDKLADSLKRLMDMDDSLVVYPGHGPSTDIGSERRQNPIIRELY